MKNLFLMRHGESGLIDGGINDFERSISENGKIKTSLISKELKSKKMKFDIVFTSPAKRTLQTVELLKREGIIEGCEVLEDQDLYEGSLENFILRLQSIERIYDSILIVTHEPNIHWFINYFIDYTNKDYLKVSKINIFTSSISHLIFATKSWKEISNINCRFDNFFNPNTLTC